MQISSINNINPTPQKIQQQNKTDNFDIMYNQLNQKKSEEVIDSYKANLLAQFEETPSASLRSSDILNLILKIK